MPTLTPFHEIRAQAEHRKGGKAGLEKLLHQPLGPKKLAAVSDDRFLAAMTRGIFQAGFNWRVIHHKWPGFEEAFHGFNPRALAHLPPEAWERYCQDTRTCATASRSWRCRKTPAS